MIIEEIKIDSDTEDGNHLIVTGRSLESILERPHYLGTANLQRESFKMRFRRC